MNDSIPDDLRELYDACVAWKAAKGQRVQDRAPKWVTFRHMASPECVLDLIQRINALECSTGNPGST